MRNAATGDNTMIQLRNPAAAIAGHPRTVAGLAASLLSYPLLPHAWSPATRAVFAWDIGAALLLILLTLLFLRGNGTGMRRNAERQQEGEWTMFWITLAGVVFSFVALSQELPNVKNLPSGTRDLRVALVTGTLILSWLVTHMVFAVRYAHEFYTGSDGGEVDGGLEFPGITGDGAGPDYWDFVYFALVLGMTFQVSDVQITSRKLRRLATVHALIGFLFNTVIVALTVNIAAGLMN